MRGKLVLIASLVIIAVILMTGCTPPAAEPAKTVTVTATATTTVTATPAGAATSAPATGKITAMNPAASLTAVERLPLAPRVSSLDGKTVYLIDIGWGGPEAGYSVNEVIAAWFAKNMPSVKTVVVRKKGSYGTDDPDLWKTVQEKGDAAIIGLSC